MTKTLEPKSPAHTQNEAGIATTTVVEMRRPGAVTMEDLMPVLDLATAVRRRNFMTQVAQTLMVDGTDYGAIPGTGSKPTLLKPGAEKLCTLWGLSPTFDEEMAIEDWTGEGAGHGGEPLFYYRYKCKLTKNGILLGEGIGSCSSRETKYRYRSMERNCPKCGKASIIRGREEYGGGWLCFGRKGGCGAKFKDGDGAIESQAAGRVFNPDLADQVNTIQKMAHKRALVCATLLVTNASEFYTQDVEDMEVIDIPAAEPEPPQKPAAKREPPRAAPLVARAPEANPAAKREGPARPWSTIRGMINEFAKLHGRLGPDHDSVYREVLREFGVEHSNQFKDVHKATSAYNKLLARVLELEDAANLSAEEYEIYSGEAARDPEDPEATV